MFELNLQPNLYKVTYGVKGEKAPYSVTFPDKRDADKFIFDYRYHIRTGLITSMILTIV